MTSRDQVFKSIRAALASKPGERTPYPAWDDSLALSNAAASADDLWPPFADCCKGVGGIPLDGVASLIDYMRATGLKSGYCEPPLAQRFGVQLRAAGIALDEAFDRAQIDAYQFGISLAASAIAETGTIVLTEGTSASRLGALAPWVHIAMVPATQVVPHLPAAIARFGKDPNIIWVTGPSKTADVEGILIEGVHGPGIQVCCRFAG